MFYVIKKYDVISVIIVIFVVIITFRIVTGCYKSIKATALPVEGKIIVIDAGHGNPDGGAIGKEGTVEQKINLQVSEKLQRLLEQSGARVIMTRSDENGISNIENVKIKDFKIKDMKERKKIRDNSKCDMFVSIHMNKYQDEKYNGAQVFYSGKQAESEKLAICIQNNIKTLLDNNNNRKPAISDNKYILKDSKVPTVIVECGFLSNYAEEKLLNDSKYQDKIAYAIYHGIIDYLTTNNGTE